MDFKGLIYYTISRIVSINLTAFLIVIFFDVDIKYNRINQ